jgi:lipopolysaccharide export system protein LptC
MSLAKGPVSLAANRGRYDIDAQRLAIDGPVAVVALDGYRLSTSDVLVDLKARHLQSDGRVRGSMRLGSFEAGQLEADLGERTINLTGGARLKIVQGGVR